MKIKGIVVPHDEEQQLQLVEIEQGNYRDIQSHVGGTFDVIDIQRPTLTSVFIHDEGKIIGLPLNRRATMLLWASDAKWRGYDIIVGDALILGPPDEEGETTAVPGEVEDLLLHTDEYKMEVQTTGNGDSWDGNQLRFTDPFTALNHVLALAERWTAVEQVRIVPS